MSVADRIKKRTFPTREVTICLDSELADERDRLLAQAKSQRGPAVRKELTAVEERMREASVTIRITGVPYAEFNKIQSGNPPRKGHMEAFNPITFFADYIYKTGSWGEPGNDLELVRDTNRSEWDALVGALSDGEFTDLANAVIQVNKRGADAGFLAHASEATGNSSPNSEQPETGE